MKIVIFILLKVAEIAAIVFVPYFVGYHFERWQSPASSVSKIVLWGGGVLLMVFGACVLYCIVVGALALYKSNCEWAEKIARKLR